MGGGVCGSIPVRQQQGPGLTREDSREWPRWENTALVLPSHRGLCLWPAAVAGRPEGDQGPSSPQPILPSTASGFQLWVGSAAYPVSLAGYTDLLPAPGPPEPNQAAVHAQRPMTPCLQLRAQQGAGQQGLYPRGASTLTWEAVHGRGTAKQHAFSP